MTGLLFAAGFAIGIIAVLALLFRFILKILDNGDSTRDG